MPRLTQLTRRPGFSAFTLASIALFIWACTAEQLTTAPPSDHSDLLSRAMVVSVDLVNHRISTTMPEAAPAGGGSLSYALAGANELGVTVTNLVRSQPGQYQPGKVRVTFDVALTNKMNAASFVTPTFPKPPAGQTGLLLFPFQISETPHVGLPKPSIDWDGDGSAGSGAPWNFFNDPVCSKGNDCYRWEAFPAPLAPQQTTSPRSVGFDLDPRITAFTVYMVLAADLKDTPPVPGSGGVAGTVTSPQRGALSGVSVGTGTATTATDGAGLYTLAGLAPGSATLTLTNLPAGCTDPGSQSATVTSGGVATVNFTVTCTTPPGQLGSVSGLVDGSPGPSGLAGVRVFFYLVSTSTPISVVTDASGHYTITNLVPGNYIVILSSVPMCTDQNTYPSISVGPGSAVTLDLRLNCPYGMIVGRVTSRQTGLPLAGDTIEIWDASSITMAVTSSTGDYQSSGLTPQSGVSVYPHPQGTCGTAVLGPVVVSAGAISTVDVQLDCSQSEVAGRVTGASGYGPIPFAFVLLTDANGSTIGFATTDRQGDYHIPGVPPTSFLAPYDVHVDQPSLPPGCVAPPSQIAIPKSGQTEVDDIQVNCDASTSTVTGVIYVSGSAPLTDLSGIRVLAQNQGGQASTTSVSALTSGAWQWGASGSYFAKQTYFFSLVLLPANCIDPGTITFLTPPVGQTSTGANFYLTCN